VFSEAMLRKYTTCPRTWFDAHPDPQAEQKVVCGAYNRGLWWNALPTIFASCADRDVLGCFAHDIATDHASAIADYTRGFEAQPVFDAAITWDDLAGYWARIRPLYPEVDGAAVLAAMRRTFDIARGDAPALSFKRQIRVVLDGLIGALPAFPSVPEAQASACALGYMTGAACDTAACAPACIPPAPDID
jgi:hypothetical protein